MSKLPRRSRRSKANGKYNGLDPDEQLTPEQACEYAAGRGVRINTNILKLQRRDGMGPKYLRIEGRFIRYTPRHLDPYIEARKPRLINPAERSRN